MPTNDEKCITILHLSDMQFGKNHQFGRFTAVADGSLDNLLKRMVGDLDQLRRDEGVIPDLVAVTGDLAEWGRKTEFDQASEFLIGLGEKLHLPKERFIIVPGNHDVNRKSCESYFCDCESNEEPPKWPAHKKWNQYERFLNDFYGHPPRFGPGNRWDIVEVPDLEVVFACLNSTMAEDEINENALAPDEIKQIREKRSGNWGHFGWCGEEQYDWFATELCQFQDAGILRIGLIHHNLERGCRHDDEHLVDVNNFRRILGDRLNLILHGHTHAANYYALAGSLMETTVPVYSTGSAGLKIDQRPEEAPMQYQLLAVRKNSVTRYGRKYDLRDKRFTADTSIDPKGKAGEHCRNHLFHETHETFNVAVEGDIVRIARRTIPTHIVPRYMNALQSNLFGGWKDILASRYDATNFLARVATVCKARFAKLGTINITRRRSPGFDREFLDICCHAGDVVQNIIVAVTSTLEKATIEQFCDNIDATYRNADPLLKSFVVIENGEPEDDTVKAFRRRGVEVLSYRQFKGLIDFTPFLHAQGRILNDERYQTKQYVTQRLIDEVGSLNVERQDALAHIHDWLLEDKAMFLLALGDFGTGKSFLVRELARRMSVETPHVVPFLLELRDMEKTHTLSEMVAAQFARRATTHIDLDAFFFMLQTGSVVLLADGFDELAVRVTYDSAAKHLETLLGAVHGRAKVLVTSRTHHFRGTRDVHTALARKLENAAHRRVVKLQPFDTDEIDAFLAKRFPDPAEAKAWGALIRNVNDLGKLAATPRMLDFILDIPQKWLRQAEERTGEISAATLYELLVKKWLEFEATKTGKSQGEMALQPEQVREAVTDLAKLLWKMTDPTAGLDELRGAVAEIIRRLNVAGATTDEAVHQLGSGSLLIRQGEGRFAFLHQSVMEWLVANDQAQLIRKGERAILLETNGMSELMADFFWGLASKESAFEWAKGVVEAGHSGNATENAELVLARLELAGVDTSSVKRNVAGQNLRGSDLTSVSLFATDISGTDLTDGSLANINARKSKWRNVIAVGADLRGADFRGADLRGSCMDRASLIGANLSGARLEGATFRQAKLTGAQFDEGALQHLDLLGASLPDVHRVTPQHWPKTAGVRCAAFHPTLPLLAAGYEDYTVRLWDVADGSCRRTLQGHTNTVYGVAFSPDGSTLASASSDNTVRLWGIEDGICRRNLHGHRSAVYGFAFSPDGTALATASGDATVRLWKIADGTCSCKLDGHKSTVNDLAFAPDGDTLATASLDKSVRVWDLAEGTCRLTLEGHEGIVNAVTYAPDGVTLATASLDKTVRVWDVAGGTCRRTLEGHSDEVWGVAFTPDGAVIASASHDKTVRLWNVADGQCLRALEGHGNPVYSVAFTPDGKTLASASADGTVRLWEVADGTYRRTLTGNSGYLYGVAIAPDGSALATGSHDKTVRIWNVADGTCRSTLEGHGEEVWGVAFAPDSATIASASQDHTVRVWDAVQGTCRHTLLGHESRVNSVAFSPHGTIIASASNDHTVRLWDATDGTNKLLLHGHTGPVYGVAFAPASTALASASLDETVRLWDVTAGTCLRTLQGHESAVYGVAFAPTDSTIATSSFDNTVRLWNIADGTCRHTLKGHKSSVYGVAFSPDGSALATGSRDTTVRVWNAVDGKHRLSLEGHKDAIWNVAFTPDGAILVSGSFDNTVRLWNVTDGTCLAILYATERGWVAYTPDGRYKFAGDLGGNFWHAIATCRFEVGELEGVIPNLRMADDEPFIRNALTK